MACGTFPTRRIKPVPPALEAWGLNHWATRVVLELIFISYVRVRPRVFTPSFEYPLPLACLLKNAVISSTEWLLHLIKNQLGIFVRVSLFLDSLFHQSMCLFPLCQYNAVSVTVLCSIVWEGYASSFVLYPQDCFGNSVSFLIPYKV